MKALKRLTPPKEDEEGVYAVFIVILVTVLLISVGLAIDWPRQVAGNQRVQGVAEEAARYGATIFVDPSENVNVPQVLLFETARLRTEEFIRANNTNILTLSMKEFRCDETSGDIVVRVSGVLRNSLSGIVLGRFRRFEAEGRGNLTFVGANNDEVKVNLCF